MLQTKLQFRRIGKHTLPPPQYADLTTNITKPHTIPLYGAYATLPSRVKHGITPSEYLRWIPPKAEFIFHVGFSPILPADHILLVVPDTTSWPKRPGIVILPRGGHYVKRYTDTPDAHTARYGIGLSFINIFPVEWPVPEHVIIGYGIVYRQTVLAM